MPEASGLIPLEGREVPDPTGGRQEMLRVLPQNGSGPVLVMGNFWTQGHEQH